MFTDEPLTFEELALAARNRGMPLEALRYDITPSGMHYLLIHFDIPFIDASTWRLAIDGAVPSARSLSLDDIRSFPSVTHTVTMECAGNGRARLQPRPLSQPWLYEAIGTATWTGARLSDVVGPVGSAATELVFTGADRGVQGDVEHDYARSLSIVDALRPEVMLAYEMNGRPLEPQHGFPLRLLVPGWYGMTSVKWLTSIRAVTEPFDGYQQKDAYRFAQTDDDPGTPVTRIAVRALMIPPGIPDFFTRRRLVSSGACLVRGRAWASGVAVARVEVGVDGSWFDAVVEQPIDEFAWQGWSFEWDAVSGDHELSARATDADGNTQPLEQPWNVQGMANNMVQTVQVTVR